MRKSLAIALVSSLVLGALSLGIAHAAKPTVVKAGNLVLKLNGDVTPKALPKKKMAPIALSISGDISTVDGSQPPVTKQVIAEFDRNGTVNAKGLPTCKSGKLQAQPTAAARKACPNAIVGSGNTSVRVAFEEQAPFTASGPLVLFNGGVKGGVTTMYIHAYVSVPAPTAIVTPVTITKIKKGRLGTRAVAKIPTIAGGAGAVTKFSMRIKRDFKYKGKKQSYLLARCADGRFLANGKLQFRDGGQIAGAVQRTCTPKG